MAHMDFSSYIAIANSHIICQQTESFQQMRVKLEDELKKFLISLGIFMYNDE